MRPAMARRLGISNKRDDLTGCGERINAQPQLFDLFAPAFFTVHERQNAERRSPLACDSFDGAGGRTARGNNVLDDDHAIATREGTFDLLSRTVCFGFLPDSKG